MPKPRKLTDLPFENAPAEQSARAFAKLRRKRKRNPELAADTDAWKAVAYPKTGPFVDDKHRRRVTGMFIGLIIAAILTTCGVLAYDIPVEFGTDGFWTIVQSRSSTILSMAVVAVCHAIATVAFQTSTANRIITPSILGFEALYIAIQTGFVFVLGAAGLSASQGVLQFFLQVGIMVLLAGLLYGWLLSGRFANIHIMLLVGVVIGGGLSSLSTFMQRMLDPNEFDMLSARLIGSLANARAEYLPYVIPMTIIVTIIMFARAGRLNVMSLGAETTYNLGLNHRREVIITLLLVAVMISMTTNLVGPMTFLGFLIASLAYSLTDTYDHRVIFPIAMLLGYVVLTGAYFVLRNIFYAQGAITVIIEIVGGLTFLIVIMKRGRL